MSSKIPAHPTGPFDATHLTDQQVLMLTDAQRYHAVLSERQLQMEEDARPPLEARPERIPSPENLAKIEELIRAVDSMYHKVRGPSGVAWIELKIWLFSLSQTLTWVESDPPINDKYRYRIDAPMNPHPDVPDHLPKEWT